MSAEQLRAARGLLGWSQSELADRAGLSLPTVKRAEADRASRVSDEARSKLRRAIEQAGVVFIEENGGGLGVRLKRKSKRAPATAQKIHLTRRTKSAAALKRSTSR
jgi:transcriptional regulator with XRE-family HTH domain